MPPATETMEKEEFMKDAHGRHPTYGVAEAQANGRSQTDPVPDEEELFPPAKSKDTPREMVNKEASNESWIDDASTDVTPGIPEKGNGSIGHPDSGYETVQERHVRSTPKRSVGNAASSFQSAETSADTQVKENGGSCSPPAKRLSPSGASLDDILKSRRAKSDSQAQHFEGGGVATQYVSCPRLPSLPVSLLFANEGSEQVGMFRDAATFQPVADLLTRAKAVLGYDVQKMCDEGPQEKLNESLYAQPLMFIAGVCAAERLRAQIPEAVERCASMAGLGVGEYAALTVAGALQFEDALKLVMLRAQAMHEVALGTKQVSMLIVSGLDFDNVSELCQEAAQGISAEAVCQVASFLQPQSFTCVGHELAIARLKALCESSPSRTGRVTAKFVESRTPAAYHTSFMEPAQSRLEAALAAMLSKIKPPRCTIYFNYSGEALAAGSDPACAADLLAAQVASPVRWVPLIEQMIRDGSEEFYELGPGRQLRSIMMHINKEKWRRTKSVAP